MRMRCNNKYTNLRLKKQTKIEVCDTFYCGIEPLNLSHFMTNLIEDLTKLLLIMNSLSGVIVRDSHHSESAKHREKGHVTVLLEFKITTNIKK